MVNVSLGDLQKNKGIYLKLTSSLVLWLLNSAKRRNVYSALAKEFASLQRGQKVSIGFALSLCQKLGVKRETLEANIELISSAKHTNVGIKGPKTPFKFDSAAAACFVAAIQGDGYFNNRLAVGYSNQNRKMVENVLDSARTIFGNIDFKLYLRKDKTFNLNFPKIIGLVLKEIGMTPGFKSSTNPAVPAFVFSLNEELKATYLKQFFSDEGNVRLKDRRVQVKQTVAVKESKNEVKKHKEIFAPKVLLGCQKLLAGFGIDSKISLGAYRKIPKGNKTDWELSFYRIENLKGFQKSIGFEQEYKNKALAQAIASYKFPSAARNGKLSFALDCCKKVQEKYGFIDKKKLATQAKRSLKTSTYYLVELKKKGSVEIAEKPKRKDGRYLLFKYKIIQNQ